MVTFVKDPREGDRVRDLEMRMQAMTDKMQRDKDFFLLVILVIVVAFILTRHTGQSVVVASTRRESDKASDANRD